MILYNGSMSDNNTFQENAMSGTEIDFDLNDVAVEDDFIPAGTYRAVLISVEPRVSKKSATSKYLNCRWQLLDYPHKNRQVFGMVTTHNDNQRAQSIGRQQIVKLRDACGLESLSDFTQLCNIPVGIKLKVEPARDGYPAQNRINGYVPASEVPGTSSTSTVDGPGF